MMQPPSGRWLVTFVFALLLLLGASVAAQDAPDELRLRDGTVLRGRVVEVDRNTVAFRTPDGVREFKRSEVRAIFLDGLPVETTEETTPGYTAVPPLKIQRVITFRQITNNRVADEGKYEPDFARISADG